MFGKPPFPTTCSQTRVRLKCVAPPLAHDLRIRGRSCAARPGGLVATFLAPRAGTVLSLNVIGSLSAVIGVCLHRPTVIPKVAGVSVMLAERVSGTTMCIFEFAHSRLLGRRGRSIQAFGGVEQGPNGHLQPPPASGPPAEDAQSVAAHDVVRRRRGPREH